VVVAAASGFMESDNVLRVSGRVRLEQGILDLFPAEASLTGSSTSKPLQNIRRWPREHMTGHNQRGCMAFRHW